MFQEGLFATVTPWRVTFRQRLKKTARGRAVGKFLNSRHQSPFWALPSIRPLPTIATSSQ